MITAELATRVAQAYNTSAAPNLLEWEKLPQEWRCAFLAVAEAVRCDERARHKADLQALAACVDDALKGCE